MGRCFLNTSPLLMQISVMLMWLHLFFTVLSISFCKQILQETGRSLTDKEVATIRAFLYSLAEIEFLNYKTTQQCKQQ
jgi:hypothetical protein